MCAWVKQWRIKHPDKYAAIKAKNKAKRNKFDILAARIAQQIRGAVKRRMFDKTFFDYSIAELATHLEKQFLPGMTWENIGAWHIDHILPICSFRGDPDGMRKAFALTNLRPLWAKDNLSKNGKRLFLL